MITSVPRISKLPKVLSNQIAAGEVIERPASVIKELLENAFDAGADMISIELESGGSRRIQIRDNGHGIHPDDMELALERHSTSKLRSQSDLDCIGSLGFRGEALASIAAVARFSLTSRIESASRGWSLHIDPVSNHSRLQPHAHPCGTTVVVENLFQAIPARKKFLRAERTEFLHIHEMVKRLALSRFASHIRLLHNNKLIMNCRDSSHDMNVRVQEIFGKMFAENAVRINYQDNNMTLLGWLGLPQVNRSQSDLQYTFINGRLIRDQKIARTIRMAYAEQIPAGRYATWVLYLEINPHLLDVNVHPTKSEVRFNQARDIHHFIHSCLQQTLSQSATSASDLTTANNRHVDEVREQANQAYSLHTPLQAYHPSVSSSRQAPSSSSLHHSNRETPLGKPVLLLAGQYVICRRDTQHRLVDAQALRQRLLRQRMQQQFLQSSIKERPLLVPVFKQVEERYFSLLELHQDALQKLGISIRLTGVNTLQFKSIPGLLEEISLDALLEVLCLQLPKDEQTDINYSQLIQAMCGAVSRDAKELSMDQVENYLCWLEESDLDVNAARHKDLWCELQTTQLAGLIRGR